MRSPAVQAHGARGRRSQFGTIQARAGHLPFIIPIVIYHGRGKGTETKCGNFLWKARRSACASPIFPCLSAILPSYLKKSCRANLADNAMLLLLQALLLRHPVDQIARTFLLLDSAMNRELMDTIRLFLNYVQQTHPDITESRIKQSIEEIAMQEGITTPMKSFEEYWFPKFYNKDKGGWEKLRGYAPQ